MLRKKFKPEKPKRRFKTYNEARLHCLWRVSQKLLEKFIRNNWWPCYRCDATGRVRDPKDHCPIEGYKLAPWYDCGKCDGTGIITRKEFSVVVHNERDRYNKAKKKYDEEMELYRSINKKLTNKEKEYLSLWA